MGGHPQGVPRLRSEVKDKEAAQVPDPLRLDVVVDQDPLVSAVAR